MAIYAVDNLIKQADCYRTIELRGVVLNLFYGDKLYLCSRSEASQMR